MAFTLTIETDNAAFEPDPAIEVARILRGVAHNVERFGIKEGSVRDVNGNTVGQFKGEWSVTEDLLEDWEFLSEDEEAQREV